ncbi:hypothetical protein I7I53_08804 [Histoplasma capsulatum var. duboisii H88]|uniref:Uncharacterized protein n=1 Tax=Ajellomyces capsulatus (strain H88) TaxID=544711 RepID=A0A8A1L7T6_AJEC8|nr:hypothetical protein I7I53_08804 [Histoplasma capsulatum var. duboisii H88]
MWSTPRSYLCSALKIQEAASALIWLTWLTWLENLHRQSNHVRLRALTNLTTLRLNGKRSSTYPLVIR